MKNGGMSCRAIARQLGCHHIITTRLLQIRAQTNDFNDTPRSGRPKTTSIHEGRNLHAGTSGIRTDESPSKRSEIVSRLQNIVLVDLLYVLS